MFIIPFQIDANAKMDLDGVCKITMLKNEHMLVQKGMWQTDGNHTCDNVDLYKIERRGHVFVKTLTCEEAEEYYKKYKGKDYQRPEKK
jgi:hypothetical protein